MPVYSCTRAVCTPFPNQIQMFSRTGVKYAISCRPLIVVDFDETITIKDTISILAHFSYARNLPTDIPPWSHFTTAYMKDYGRLKSANAARQITSLEDKTEQLASLKPVELASLDRVSKAGVFARLTKEEIQAGAKELVQVRDHAQQVLLSNIENVFILSVNWSKDWILGALKPLPLLPSAILSNDLVFNEGISTGQIIPSIVTADDKLKIFRQIQNANTWPYSIYIGDSETDLPCLVNADIGIVFGTNTSLINTCKQIGIELKDAKQVQSIENKQDRHTLYHTVDWADIADLLKDSNMS
ncbi:hypothetical protein K450DRAFT_242851 [Umbelopsis ramanniana AG]|uniref:Uncharacterized protein n=1 Tax=Umbelopsis ramanniana AG TaxID=1314678 RepID=A0AAD5E9X0_UMBRA|nr:uncharacterized protein K450DRAFT_242851 [Umbelopsis ramanniana AG]KAI8579349.1 hypothetical protein K450DRAFT_242851 [Umbelopsis ramanniana AG]